MPRCVSRLCRVSGRFPFCQWHVKKPSRNGQWAVIPPRTPKGTAMIPTILLTSFNLIGSLGLFLYGMKILSDGLQRAAGDNLKRALGYMTRNSFSAVLTGFVVTGIIQSSSASTVMVVSFVNAGLLTLVQAIGVIMGANIGTTVTAWIVSLVGFKFDIAAMAIPCVGIGFIMTFAQRKGRTRDYGEALIGFGLLFLGLKYLSHAIPAPDAATLRFLERLGGYGALSTIAFAAAGALLTMLIHSSSASTAIVITLAVEGVIGFPMAAALVLGCNIGTTIDALLSSIGTKVNARRAAMAHLLFNVLGTIWAILFFKPFLALVDLVTPGAPELAIATHIAMLHTLFNTINTVLLFPFISLFARGIERLVKPGRAEAAAARIAYVAAPLVSSPELNLIAARKEIADMAGLARSMFARFRANLKTPPADLAAELEWFRTEEGYADQMQEELARFLLEVTRQNVSDGTQADIGRMLRVVDELENITDACMSLALVLDRREHKGLKFDADELDELAPYTLLAENFLRFVEENAARPISADELALAADYEQKLDDFRSSLKKKARKRLKAGADVKTELLFIDLVRHVEKIGDYGLSIAESLRELR